MKQAEAATLARDKITCTVLAMPKVAIELGVTDHVVPLDVIPGALIDMLDRCR
ncbi:MAG: chemotaxis protein CheB [Candidatus Binatia bacterium]